MSAARKWDDLWVRIVSAVGLLAIGALEVWLGGHFFHAFVAVIAGLMVWELMRMLTGQGGGSSVHIAVLCGVVVMVSAYLPGMAVVPVLAAAVLVGLGQLGKNRMIWLLYAPLILLASYSLMWVRDGLGIAVLFWLLAVVIASDVCGYFAGRLLGGPKFWPQVSPKKTWSGTIAGWIGAALVGFAFAPTILPLLSVQVSALSVIAFSVLMSIAAQMGDIAESAIKRHVGIKDSSALIPGHGGFLDRFDALIGASVLLLILGLAV